MDRTPEEIAQIVYKRFGPEIEQQRKSVRGALERRSEALRTSALWNDTCVPIRISGPAVDTDDVEIDAWQTWEHPEGLGTFDPSDGVLQVNIWVNSRHPTKKNSDGVPTWVRAPIREVLGWARAIMGDYWADYAYRVHTLRGELGRWPQLVLVLVDHAGTPMLAPSDYEWESAGVGGPAYPHKLAPRPENKELTNLLKAEGDVRQV